MSDERDIRFLYPDLDRMEECDVVWGGDSCNQFCIACLSLIQHQFPPIALEALALAKDYSAQRTDLSAVVEMKIRCWKELDSTYKGMRDVDAPVAAIRAVICVLLAQQHPEDNDTSMQLLNFLEFVTNVEPNIKEIGLLFQKYFPQCFGLARSELT